jgi:L-ascorbate metabolism protein UlaG (beta-lactamase superfamily)
VKAFQELQARTLIPMHFGTYRMSYEPMHEPEERLKLAGAEHNCLHQIQFLAEGMPKVF